MTTRSTRLLEPAICHSLKKIFQGVCVAQTLDHSLVLACEGRLAREASESGGAREYQGMPVTFQRDDS